MRRKDLHRAVAQACGALTRRELLGAAAAAAALPLASLAHAAVPRAATAELPDDWSIDDQWTGYPRLTDAMPLPRIDAPALVFAPVDAGFAA